MTLVETGTRALLGAVFGPTCSGETSYATRLLHLLGPGMLVLADRGFDGNQFLAAVARTRAQFLVRLAATRRPPIMARLDDGSFVSMIGGVRVRIITGGGEHTCRLNFSYCGPDVIDEGIRRLGSVVKRQLAARRG